MGQTEGGRGVEMRLVKEQIRLEQPLARGWSEALVEGEIVLEGGLREEARVLYAGASACVERVEALQDRLSAAGRVAFRTLYTQGEPARLCAMEATADFTHLMELSGVEPRAAATLTAQVEQVEARAYGGRLLLRARVRIGGAAVSHQPVEAVTALADAEGVQVRTRQAELLRTVAGGAADTLLREEIALPQELQIRETLWGTAHAAVDAVTGGVGRAGISGRLALEAVHLSDQSGRPLVVTRHVLPLSLHVDLAGEEAGAMQGSVCVKDVAVMSQEGGDGQRVLRAEILLGLRAAGTSRESLTLLEDAYTLSGDDLRLKSRTVEAVAADDALAAEESGKVSVVLPGDALPLRSVLCAFATPCGVTWQRSGMGVSAEGRLQITLLYMSDDPKTPRSVTLEEPFRCAFAVDAAPGDVASLHALEVEALPLTSDRAEVRYTLHMTARRLRTAPLPLVTEVLSVPAEEPGRSIMVCFAQPGEGLWDIARRCRVTQEGIREINPGLQDEVTPGQGVVVWRRG